MADVRGNGRGTAEQQIKERKNALRWTRLSCHAFRHNAVRLQLHALAYNRGVGHEEERGALRAWPVAGSSPRPQ